MDRRDDRRRRRRRPRRDRGRRVAGRVPPHNLQAEESVLGALLLSRDAIGAVSEQGLRPDDFYKPAHQHIFDAIRVAVLAAGAPADTVTVADELRRAGLLDEVGGAEALHELQNATPAISNAAHYARIVQDTALLRRLIHVAGDIAEIAYSEPDDVTKALDEAETKVFEVAEDRVTDSTRPLSELAQRGDGPASRRRTSAATRSPARPPATTTSTSCCRACSRDAEHRRRPPGDGQDRVRPRHGHPRRPDDAASRCSCSRWRWATTS